MKKYLIVFLSVLLSATVVFAQEAADSSAKKKNENEPLINEEFPVTKLVVKEMKKLNSELKAIKNNEDETMSNNRLMALLTGLFKGCGRMESTGIAPKFSISNLREKYLPN